MHWTYENWDCENDLCQGDILEPTDELIALFKKVHPHFIHEKYRNFLILTQTCDLATRQGNQNVCSASHINLSVVRTLHDIITDSLKDSFGCLTPGVYAQHMKRAIDNLLERIVNQNENKLGLFYLHPDLDSGITVPSVAILRVAISLKAPEHYPLLKTARVGRLSKEFQPKLGWMVGNLYSRVGVTDWKEIAPESGVLDEAEIIHDILCCSTRKDPIWVDMGLYKKIQKKEPNFENLSSKDQEKIIQDMMPPPPRDKVFEIIRKTIKDVIPKVKEGDLKTIENRLKNDQQLEGQMRRFV